MKNPKVLLIVVGVILLTGIGFFFVRGPKPIIEIKAETLIEIGPLGDGGFLGSPITNTWVASVATVMVLVVVGYMAGRKASLIPGPLQNLVESVLEAGYNLCVSTAGEKHGRRFFPVFMTILMFVWIANWMALLPFFNAIGAVEKVNADDFHAEALVMSKSSGMQLVEFNKKSLEFDVDPGACSAYETTGTSAPAAPDAAERLESCTEGQQALAITEKLASKEDVHVGDPATCPGSPGDIAHDDCLVAMSDKAIEALNADGKTLGIIKPYFRSMNTDINSPLSIAIMSAIFVEFWGISALGLFKYGKKFINFSSPINLFVGFLETIAEIARIISFTFRLFGNVLAGDIILLVMTFLIPFVVAVPFYGLEMFFGMIQAFIFAMLTLVFGVLAVSTHDDHNEHENVEVTALH